MAGGRLTRAAQEAVDAASQRRPLGAQGAFASVFLAARRRCCLLHLDRGVFGHLSQQSLPGGTSAGTALDAGMGSLAANSRDIRRRLLFVEKLQPAVVVRARTQSQKRV